MNPKAFQKKVWNFYTKQGRHTLPWRKTKDPYKILVSEIMLQQTQADRVVPKYKNFLKVFPNATSLAATSNLEVLKIWSGLGYNRRALFLKRSAEYVVKELKGKFPKTVQELEKLPGVGPYTARAVATFAYNQSHVFIETNIRTVYLHEFFQDKEQVSDADVLPLIEKTLSSTNAREWGWALMDYGSYLKKTFPNPSKRSKHHVKQSTFDGSLRQVRGAILKYLTVEETSTKAKIMKHFKEKFGVRTDEALQGLAKDGFIYIQKGGRVTIS